jgi:hypothetical protein
MGQPALPIKPALLGVTTMALRAIRRWQLPGNPGQQAGNWAKSNPQDATKVLGPLWGNLDVTTVEAAANDHRSYQVQAVSTDQLGEQQKIADAFYSAGRLPKNDECQRSRHLVALSLPPPPHVGIPSGSDSTRLTKPAHPALWVMPLPWACPPQ